MAGSFHTLSAYQPELRRNIGSHRFPAISTTKSDPDEDPLVTNPVSAATDEQHTPDLTRTHRKLVFTDPVAFRYLEEDQSTTVLARRHRLEGYELYVVEQWVVSRTQPTFTICTYTGDNSHSILVNVLAVPNDQASWSDRLRVYFEAVSQSYARERETHLGTLMVTNLSGFPSALHVIPVPDGDVKRHREDFIVNENLKRMGCAGRAAMSLQYPQPSTITKFHHMYHTSEKVPLYPSVLELVRFCQLALVLYGKLDSTYADGLLCDITEKSVSEWWNEIGTDFHNVEPSDGILGPTTVSALIGLVIGAYNRLKEIGAPVGKDPIDLSSMKRAIAHFQKSQKMNRSRRLDRATLDRLHRVTAHKAEDEGLAVTRALKSTVAGLSGKGGEMIARGFGGGKEKAGIAEVETLDIERLAQLVTGRSMKWLWQGKEKGLSSAGIGRPSDELNGRVFSVDDRGNFIWTSEAKDGEGDPDLTHSTDPEDRESKRGRLRDAVGLTSNKGDSARNQGTDDESSKQDFLAVRNPLKEVNSTFNSQRSSRDTSQEKFPPLDLALARESINSGRSQADSKRSRAPTQHRDRSDTARSAHRQVLRGLDHKGRESPSKLKERMRLAKIREELNSGIYNSFSANFSYQQPLSQGLRKTRSAVQLRSLQEGRTAKLPRQLSFNLVVDALDTIKADDSETDSAAHHDGLHVTAKAKINEDLLRQSQDLAYKLSSLGNGLIPFATGRVERVEHIGSEGQSRLEDINGIYYHHLEEYQTLQATSTDLVAREKTSLNEAMRSIDMLGQKLDYELDSLGSRMQEVEESVDDFERRVRDIETSVKILIAEEEKDKRPAWYERWLPFVRSVQTNGVKEPKEADTTGS